jgi:hypothetical protein
MAQASFPYIVLVQTLSIACNKAVRLLHYNIATTFFVRRVIIFYFLEHHKKHGNSSLDFLM